MKIAVFTNWPHYYIGGVETYVSYLMQVLKERGHDVTEYYTLKPGSNSQKRIQPLEGINSIDSTSRFNSYRFKASRNLNKLVADEKIDLIINNTTMTTDKALKSKKVIHVQHINWKSYTRTSEWIKSTLDKYFLRMGTNKNPLKYSTNIVFFNKGENKGSRAKKILYVSHMIGDNFFAKSSYERKNVFWVGRHVDSHKGLVHLNEVAKLYFSDHKEKIVVGGDGENTSIIDEKYIRKLGPLRSSEVVRQFKLAKVFILTSNYEGDPFTVKEALSSGVPVVLFNTFENAKNYRNSPFVKVIEPFNYQKFEKAINNLLVQKHDPEIIKKYARKEFGKERFANSWINFINEVAK